MSSPHEDAQDHDKLLECGDDVASLVRKELKLPPHQLPYRSDIDGLRTLAVVPVLLFHAYPETFAGGFIGVDIFFVISGYLISGILFKEFHANTFTYASFYSRRIRRIFPVLLLVLISTMWMGCLYLLADGLKTLSATMLAGTLFCANIQVLSFERGYFDADVKMNPLLHLWSLGVEEQFYIFWPFFASLVTRLSVRKSFMAQIGVLLASFLANIAMLGYHDSNKFSFYFPLCRFWQMAMGGLLAYANFLPQRETPSRNQASTLSYSGFFLILSGFVLLNESSRFPGYWALLPSGGAALLIAAGPSAPVNMNFLSNDLMVYIGKISYALYLWHWPLLVFAKVRYPNADSRPFYMQPFAMLFVAYCLSINFSSFEDKVRRNKSSRTVPLLAGAMVIVAALALTVCSSPGSFSFTEIDLRDFGSAEDTQLSDMVPDPAPVLSVLKSKNFTTVLPSPTMVSSTDSPNPSRESRVKMTTYKQAIAAGKDNGAAWEKGFLPLNQSSPYGYHPHAKILNPGHEDNGLVIVIGDSHADMAKPRFHKLYEDALATNRSFPTIVFKSAYGRPVLSCREETLENFEMIKRLRPQAVLVTFHWLQYLRPGGQPNDPLHDPVPCCKSLFDDDCKYQSRLDVDELLYRWRAQMEELTSLGIRVYVVQRHVESGNFYFVYWVKGEAISKLPKAHNLTEFRTNNAELMQKIESAVNESHATLLDYSDNLCWQNKCEVVNGEGEPLYSDSNHIRAYTSRKYLSVLDQVVSFPRPNSIRTSMPEQSTMTKLVLEEYSPNPSRETRKRNTTYLQALKGGADHGVVWEEGLSFLDKSSPYGYHPHDQVLNPGHESNGLVIVLGDSHADMLKPRFVKLYNESIARNDSFPSMVFKTEYGRAPMSCNADITALNLEMVKRIRPQVVFYSFHWLQYLRPDAPPSTPKADDPRCCKTLYESCPYQSQEDADELLHRWKEQVKDLVALGIQVYVAQQYVENSLFYYRYWVEGNHIKPQTKPVSRTKFNLDHAHLLSSIATAVAESNATLIDFSDNLCWGDACVVVNGDGEPIYADDNHIRSYSVKKYLSVIDQVVDAARLN